MAVEFEFEVDGERCRVTRSMPRNRATKILVQRLDGGEWKQAGEGADRVRDANRMLRETIGLDFDGFTRSVLLPQGKFSAFMAGDASQRREILTDLLGLSVFDRMGRRARQIAKEATDRAATYEELIASQFAEATPEALEAARRRPPRRPSATRSWSPRPRRLTAVMERWKAVAEAVRELRACAADANRVADGGGAARGRAGDAGGASRPRPTRRSGMPPKPAAGAAENSEAAGLAVEQAEREHGTAADLARAGDAGRGRWHRPARRWRGARRPRLRRRRGCPTPPRRPRSPRRSSHGPRPPRLTPRRPPPPPPRRCRRWSTPTRWPRWSARLQSATPARCAANPSTRSRRAPAQRPSRTPARPTNEPENRPTPPRRAWPPQSGTSSGPGRV